MTAPSAPAESAPAAPATSATGATALPAAPRSAESDTYKGLPRRRRSQRRPQPTPPAPAPSISRPVSTDRSLEEIRQMMSAFQRGTRTGRTEGNTDHPTTETR